MQVVTTFEILAETLMSSIKNNSGIYGDKAPSFLIIKYSSISFVSLGNVSNKGTIDEKIAGNKVPKSSIKVLKII